MVINTNLPALNASVRLGQTAAQLAQSLQRLSSGSKLASAADDSAGQAMSMHLTSKLGRLEAALNNIGNAISFSQTQDGYLQKANYALNRMGELSMLAMDATKTNADRRLYQQEFHSLGVYVNEVGTKNFNGVSLFNSVNLWVTTDPEVDGRTFFNSYTKFGIDLNNTTLAAVVADDVGTAATAVTAMQHVKAALDFLASSRADVGLGLETLAFYHDQTLSLKNNLSAANSRITDVDVAQESTNYAKFNILTQAGTAMLAQANSLPQSVLKLLG